MLMISVMKPCFLLAPSLLYFIYWTLFGGLYYIYNGLSADYFYFLNIEVTLAIKIILG